MLVQAKDIRKFWRLYLLIAYTFGQLIEAVLRVPILQPEAFSLVAGNDLRRRLSYVPNYGYIQIIVPFCPGGIV